MIKMDIYQFVSNEMLVPQQLLWHMLLQAGRDSIHTTQKIFNSCIGRNAINANRIYVGYTDVAYDRWKTKLHFMSTHTVGQHRHKNCGEGVILFGPKNCQTMCLFWGFEGKYFDFFLIICFQAGQEAFRSITRSYYRYVFFVSQAPFLTFLLQRSSWSSACLRHHAERHFQPLGEESI